jgi:type IV pilus assembly protein PilC
MYQHYDKSVKIAGKVRSALAYPIFVLVIAVAVVIVLMVKVVPTFTEMFEAYGAELPVMTQILINISHFFQNYILIIIAVIAVLIIAYKLYGNTEEGRLQVAQWKRKIPVLGNINVLNSAVQFSDTMTTMLASGIPLNKAVSITARVIDNYYVSQEVGKLATKLEEGRSLGASMRESGCMPDILTDMVAVGEETGEMEDTLRTIGNYYENELQMAMDAALKKLEPTLLIGLAVVAGFIVIAIYMAMFEMYNAM